MLAPKTHNNIRDDIVTFLRWASSPAANYVPAGYFATAELENLVEPECLKTTIPSLELAKLFAATSCRQNLACLALAKDAGIRVYEIPRVKKKFIIPGEKKIALPGFDEDGTRITKTGKGRTIPMSRRLWERLKWMFDEKLDDDFRISRKVNWTDELRIIARAADVVMPDNALRHGYGTHRLKLTQKVGKVSLEMGNTVYVLLNHYAKETNKSESLAWFAV
jgi:integrase